MAGTSEKRRLRILSYMSPDIPYDVFTFFRDIIEEATNSEVDLMIENRFSGPHPDRADPFKENLADIVILHSADYLRLKSQDHPNLELCPAGMVHEHEKAGDKPVYFSEIIILSANKDKYKSFNELKGCSWAYSDNNSVSGNLVVLSYLRKKHGSNASYFGSIIQSGTHLNSIKMVLEHRADAAAVDSNVLSGYLREHPDQANKFTSLVTLGPLPIYPILYNTNLPGNIREQINGYLFGVDKSPLWGHRMSDLKLVKFAPVDPDLYTMEEDIQQGSKGMKINMTYY